jgi:glutamine---fructose-6-phosphate transaminase (isomerizing)
MDRREASRTGQVRQQVLSKPQLIRDIFPKFDRQVRQLIDHETCLGVQRVFAGGSGDSHNAALAAEMAFRTVARMPMTVLNSMALSRYTLPWLTPDEMRRALVIGISVSGEVSRTVEAVKIANERGALTLGLTANSQSALAENSKLTFDMTLPPPVESPGVRAYTGSVLAMYAVALRLAVVRERIPQAVGDQWKKAILQMADVIEKTNLQISDTVKRAANLLRERQYFIFMGSGPNYATSLFGAAKLVETTGRHVLGQDIEEWAHLQRFDKEQGNPCFLIAPPGIGYRRAVEVAQNVKRTGKYLIAITEEGETEISGIADLVLPICGHVPEELTPLVYSTPLELFASDLAQELGEPYFRFGLEPWESSGGKAVIQASQINDLGTLYKEAHVNVDLWRGEN